MTDDFILKQVTNTLKLETRGYDREEARRLRDYASAKLDLAEIKYRAQELQSQFEPVASWGNRGLDARELVALAAQYIITGKNT